MALDFFAGCLGGCAGVIVGHPLDTIKVHLQTQSIQNPKYNGPIHCFKSLVAKEGIRSIYRGITSPIGSVAAINAIIFGVYGTTQRQFSDPDSLKSVTLAGCTAGLVQTVFVCPMELIKSKMQVTSGKQQVLDFVRRIYRNEGIRGMYRGLNSTIVREIPAFGIYFMSYDLMTKNDDGKPISTAVMLTAGGFAGMLSWLFIYPIDVIKTRLQLDNIHSPKYSGIFDCFQKCVQSEGYAGLFRGLTPTLLRAFPVNAVTFTIVTWTMRLFNGDGLTETEYIWEKYTDAVSKLKVIDSTPV